MKINKLEKSYINISGNIYDSEFINLANVNNNKIALDKRTIFLTEEKKEILNSQEIKRFDDAVYIFKHSDTYGMICDLPIKEYTSGKIKCHELVLPDTIQGMLSNLHGYNCEVAPILLAHEKNDILDVYSVTTLSSAFQYLDYTLKQKILILYKENSEAVDAVISRWSLPGLDEDSVGSFVKLRNSKTHSGEINWGDNAELYTALFALKYACLFRYIGLPNEKIKDALLQIF